MESEDWDGGTPAPELVNFGALPPLPEGYAVVWVEPHYLATGPGGWEGLLTWDRFRARKEALAHAFFVNKFKAGLKAWVAPPPVVLGDEFRRALTLAIRRGEP